MTLLVENSLKFNVSFWSVKRKYVLTVEFNALIVANHLL